MKIRNDEQKIRVGSMCGGACIYYGGVYYITTDYNKRQGSHQNEILLISLKSGSSFQIDAGEKVTFVDATVTIGDLK